MNIRSLILLPVILLGCSDAVDRPSVDPESQNPVVAKQQRTFVGSGPTAAVKKTDWPQFRGIGGLGVSDTTDLPTSWSPDENIAWKTKMPGPGTSSPIVVGDRIFLTCYSGFGVSGQGGRMEDLKLHLVCLNRDKGDVRWTKTIAPSFPEQPTIRESHGYASCTPVADGERVYVFFGKTGVFAFDFTGRQLWHAKVGSGLSGWGSAASPILHGDLLIVNASVESQSLVALDKRTGKEKWRAEGVREAWNTPLIMQAPNGRTELIVPIVRNILAFNPTSGEKLWWCDTGINWYMAPSVVAHKGVIYCVGGRSNDALAVRGGGSGDVTRSHIEWKARKGSNVTSPVYHQGHLYWMNENLGVAYCANVKTGDIVYQERINRAGQVYASPVLADGKIYYVNRGGRTFVVAAQPKFRLLATNDLEERGRFDASPAVADGRLLLRSNRYLYCIGNK